MFGIRNWRDQNHAKCNDSCSVHCNVREVPGLSKDDPGDFSAATSTFTSRPPTSQDAHVASGPLSTYEYPPAPSTYSGPITIADHAHAVVGNFYQQTSHSYSIGPPSVVDVDADKTTKFVTDVFTAAYRYMTIDAESTNKETRNRLRALVIRDEEESSVTEDSDGGVVAAEFQERNRYRDRSRSRYRNPILFDEPEQTRMRSPIARGKESNLKREASMVTSGSTAAQLAHIYDNEERKVEEKATGSAIAVPPKSSSSVHRRGPVSMRGAVESNLDMRRYTHVRSKRTQKASHNSVPATPGYDTGNDSDRDHRPEWSSRSAAEIREDNPFGSTHSIPSDGRHVFYSGRRVRSSGNSALPPHIPLDESMGSKTSKQPDEKQATLVNEPVRLSKRSGLGCWYCRSRRIKCDEQRPICESCRRMNIACDYGPPSSFPYDPFELFEVFARGSVSSDGTIAARREAKPIEAEEEKGAPKQIMRASYERNHAGNAKAEEMQQPRQPQLRQPKSYERERPLSPDDVSETLNGSRTICRERLWVPSPPLHPSYTHHKRSMSWTAPRRTERSMNPERDDSASVRYQPPSGTSSSSLPRFTPPEEMQPEPHWEQRPTSADTLSGSSGSGARRIRYWTSASSPSLAVTRPTMLAKTALDGYTGAEYETVSAPTQVALRNSGIAKQKQLDAIIPEGFVVHANAEVFFTPGRVFAVLWSKPLSANTTSSQSFLDGSSLSQVRRMISIANTDGKCYCVSFSTYLGRGLNAPGLTQKDIDDHVVLYTGDKVSMRRGEPIPEEHPVKVNVAPGQSLHKASRLYLARMYVVEWGAQAMNIGNIDEEDVDVLKGLVRRKAEFVTESASDVVMKTASRR